mgnify:CR=1 FL=1
MVVYPGSAQVIRLAPVAAGARELVLTCLSARFDADSLQISAPPGVNLGPVQVETLPRERVPDCANSALDEQLRKLEAQRDSLNAESGESFLERVLAEFYVPTESARNAIHTHQSFNLLAESSGFKADFFVAGDGLLDRRQLERRVLIPLPDVPAGLWVTSPEDQVLRKLDWYRMGGSVSDRQWRDVVGIIIVRGAALDLDYLRDTAGELDLLALLEEAIADAVE